MIPQYKGFVNTFPKKVSLPPTESRFGKKTAEGIASVAGLW